MRRRIFSQYERVTYDDLNLISTDIYKTVMDRLLYRLGMSQSSTILGSGLEVTRTSATAATVAAGEAMLLRASAPAGEPDFITTGLAASAAVTFAAADSTNPRIDIVILTPAEVTSSEIRDLRTGGTGSVYQASVPKVGEYFGTVSVVTGTPAGTPAVPATPAGSLKLAEVYITANTGIVNQAAITEMVTRRHIPVVSSDSALNTDYVRTEAGTAALPGHSFKGYQNAGMYYDGSLRFSSNSAEFLRAGQSGNVTFGGSTTSESVGAYFRRAITGGGATTGYGLYLNALVTSDGIITRADGFTTTIGTAAGSGTIGTINHFQAVQGTLNNANLTNQHGFLAGNSLTGATNNYGFRGQIPSGTGRWNLYMDGSAPNYLAGSLGIGSVANLDTINFRIQKPLTGGPACRGILVDSSIQSDVTSEVTYYRSTASTAAAAFTVANVTHYMAFQSTIGAGSAITNQTGFYVLSNVSGATNNYGFRGDLAAAANVWNLYMPGTAQNYLAGNLGIGSGKSVPSVALDVAGSIRVDGAASIFTALGTAGVPVSSYSTLEVECRYANETFSTGLHLHRAGNYFGMFLGSYQSDVAMISTGSHYSSAGNYRATATTSAIYNQHLGQNRFFSNSGLTVGNSFAATLVANLGENQALFLAGTAALPGISCLTDLDTGIYFPAANNMGFVTGGVERFRIVDGDFQRRNGDFTTYFDISFPEALTADSYLRLFRNMTASGGGSGILINKGDGSTGIQHRIYIKDGATNYLCSGSGSKLALGKTGFTDNNNRFEVSGNSRFEGNVVVTGSFSTPGAITTADTITGFNATGLADGTPILFKGRDAVGDGGGGYFLFTTSTSETAEGGVVFTPTGGGRLLRDGISPSSGAGRRERVYAQYWGAKGDSSTDDRVALQNAFNYIATYGGTLIIPRGNYILSSGSISLSTAVAPFTITGDGIGATKLTRSGSIGTPISIQTSARFTLCNFTIECNTASHPTNANHGISIYNCSNVVLRDIEILNHKNTAFLVYANSTTYANCSVENCYVDGNTTGVNGILIGDLQKSGMRQCFVKNCKGGGYGLQLKNAVLYGYIEDCYVENCTVGIAFGQDTGTAAVRDSMVSNVRVYNCVQGISIGYASDNMFTGINIVMGATLNHVIDIDNSSNHNTFNSIRVSDMSVTAGDVIVRVRNSCTNNVFQIDRIQYSGTLGTVGLINIAAGCNYNTFQLGRVSSSVNGLPANAYSDSGTGNIKSYLS